MSNDQQRVLAFNNVPLMLNPHLHLDEHGESLGSVAVILDEEKELDCIRAGLNVRYEPLWGPYIVIYCVSSNLKKKGMYPDETLEKFPENSDIPNDRIFVGSVKFSIKKYSLKTDNKLRISCSLVDISKN